MTVEIKIQIMERAIELFKERGLFICIAVERAACDILDEVYISDYYLAEMLPELFKYKPKGLRVDVPWFDLDYSDDRRPVQGGKFWKQRLRILEKVLAELKEKVK